MHENLRRAKRRAERAQHHLDYHKTKLQATKQTSRCEERWQEIVAAFEDTDLQYGSEDEEADTHSIGAMSTDDRGSTDFWSKRTAGSPGKSQGTAHASMTPANQLKPLSHDQVLHYAALMRMIQGKGNWSTDLQRELEVIATQIQAEQLEQETKDLEQQQAALGIAPAAAEVAPGVSPDGF